MKIKLFTSLLLLLSTGAYSQDINGTITDSTGSGLPFQAVGLLNASDSAVVKGALSDDKGRFTFNGMKPGPYLVMSSGAGYHKTYSGVFRLDSVNDVEAPRLVMRSSAISLNEVAVSAVRSPIEFKGGNVVVNIDNSPLAVGNTAYELLGRLPGVMVDNDDISVHGQGGVRVYIDDRPQQMSGAQLMGFLRSLNSSQIEKIEVIINPPARYDAAGKGAIINIVTKKVRMTGFSGDANYTFSQGYYANNNGSFSLNYKGNKINLFNSVSFYEGLKKYETAFDRRFTSGSETTLLSERSYNVQHLKQLTWNMAADWYINKNNTLGIKIQAYPGETHDSNPGIITNNDPAAGYSQMELSQHRYNGWFYGNYNLNYEHKFDTNGTVLKFSADVYNPYIDFYESDFNTRFVNGGVDVLPRNNFRNENKINLNMYAERLDFEKKLSKTVSFTSGVKSSYNIITSDYKLEKQNLAGVFETDSNFTNQFRYREHITAAYINVEKEWKKMNGHIGLRAENTDIKTNSITSGLRYTRQYLQVFPVLSLNYNASPSHIFSIAANTRIHRPDYNSFNPYRWFENITTSGQGNPYLLPEYNYNLVLNYVFKSRISNTLSYNYGRNPFLGYPVQNDSTKTTINKLQNVSELQHYRYVFYIRQDIKKWWTTGLNVGAYYIFMKGQLEGGSFFNSAVPWWIWNNQQFILKNNWKIEVMTFYWSPWLGGVGRMEERWGVDIAVKKSFLNKKLNLTVALNDIFFTKKWTISSRFRNQDSYRVDAQDTRRLNIGLSYNFGKVRVEQRQVESAHEEGRIGK